VPAHDSGSRWYATPFLYGSFIRYSLPALTGAFKVSPQFPPFLGTAYSTRGNSPEFYHPPSFPLPVARSSAILFLQRYTPRETVTKWFDYQAG
jgi:hypothetical protein